MRDVSIGWYRNRDSRYNMQEALLTTTSRKPNVSLRIILRRWYSWVAESIDSKEMCHVLTLSIVYTVAIIDMLQSLRRFPKVVSRIRLGRITIRDLAIKSPRLLHGTSNVFTNGHSFIISNINISNINIISNIKIIISTKRLLSE